MGVDQPAEPLLIDRSMPEPVSDTEVRSWISTQTVFVSSVMAGMTEERKSAASAVEGLGGNAVLFERLGGRDDDAETAYLDGVRASDIYLGLLGPRYGILDANTGYAPTHAEYNEAIHCGLRISVWATVGAMSGPQSDFLRTVQTFHTTGSYRTPDDLRVGIERRLRELASEAGSPWCKLGSVIFRAGKIEDAGDRIVIEATVRNPDVVDRLTALRPNEWGREGTSRVTWSGATAPVSIDAVTVSALAGRARGVRIEATRARTREANWMSGAGFDGRSSEEMTERAVRVALLGEPNPLGTMGFLAEMPDPLSPLRGLQLGEDSVPALAELLVTEVLVGTGRVKRVTTVRVGPRHRGRRRVLVEWVPEARFGGTQLEVRSVEGEVPA